MDRRRAKEIWPGDQKFCFSFCLKTPLQTQNATTELLIPGKQRRREAGPCLVLDLRWQSAPEGSWRREERRGSQREEVDWSAPEAAEEKKEEEKEEARWKTKREWQRSESGFVASDWDCSAAGLTWLQRRAKGQSKGVRSWTGTNAAIPAAATTGLRVEGEAAAATFY